MLNDINSDNWDELIENNDYNNTISGNNLLHMACARGKYDVIQKIINIHPKLIYLSNKKGENCSHILIKNGWFDILKSLINNHPDLLLITNQEKNSLFQIITDQPVFLKWLIKTVDNISILDNVNSNGKTLLLQLIELFVHDKIDIEIIIMLLKKNINLNHPVKIIPLNYAVNLNSKTMVQLLLDYGANPNFKDSDNKNALMLSVHNNYLDITQILLSNGANVNTCDYQLNFFPLITALNNKNKDITELVLKYDPNMKFSDRYLNTPAHYCLYSNSNSNIQWLSPTTIFKILYSSDLNSKNIKGITCLHILNYTGLWKFYTEILKSKKLDIHVKDYKGRTPISLIDKSDYHLYLETIGKNAEHTTNNNDDIIMPETIPTNFGKFNSDILHSIIYTLLFLKKYENLMIPYKYGKYSLSPDLYKSPTGNLLYSIVNLINNKFTEIRPHIVFWHNRNVYYFDDELGHCIKDLIRNNKVRFIMIKLTVIAQATSTHANIILYDKTKNELYRFEPYGYMDIMDYDYLDAMIKERFNKYVNKYVKYYSPKDYLTETKFQLISNETNNENKKLGDPFGYCLAYCFWFIEMRINNEDLHIKELMINSLQKIITDIDNANPIMDYIRNYANKLNNMSEQFMKDVGLDEKDIYNISYDEDNMTKILQYCKNYFKSITSKS